jgi:hypothetical protein
MRAVLAGFRRRHRQRSRLIASVLGWGDLGSDVAARDFVSTRPFVSLRPLGSGHQPTGVRIAAGAGIAMTVRGA